MSVHNTKNYEKQGGEEWVIGGTLTFLSGATIVGMAGVSGLVVQQAAITPLTAASGTAGNTVSDVGDSFSQTTLNNNFASVSAKINAIITAIQAAGVTL